MPKTTLLQRLQFLANEMGLTELEVLSKAIEAGISVLYERYMGEQYMAGEISHETALQLLGPHRVAHLDCIMRGQCEEDEFELACGHA